MSSASSSRLGDVLVRDRECLVEDRKTKEPSPKKTAAFLEAAKRQGLLIGKGGLYGNVIRIAPSMLISKADIDDGCTRMERALAEVK